MDNMDHLMLGNQLYYQRHPKGASLTKKNLIRLLANSVSFEFEIVPGMAGDLASGKVCTPGMIEQDISFKL